MGISAANAEIVAFQALEWLVSNDELRPVFLGSSGATLDHLKEDVLEPELLAGLLEFLLQDDEWVVAFSEAMGYPNSILSDARQSLPGAEEPNWT